MSTAPTEAIREAVASHESPLHLPDLDPKLRAGVPRTVYDDVDPAYFLGPNGTQLVLANKQGLKLKAYFWPAAHPKCVLTFIHGHGAHLQFELLKFTTHGQPQAYENSWAQALNAAGISVCGIDNQGCGRSEGLYGLRFYVENFQDYVDDVLQLARSFDALNVAGFSSALPSFISGISLGGCIAFNAALQAPEQFKGVLLLAPMLSLERVSRKGLNPYLRPVATALSWLCPTAAIVATDRNAKYPEIQEMWDKDPLTSHTNTRVRNAHEYMRITESTMKMLEEVTFPFIVFHSENDTMCDPDGSKQLYTRASVRVNSFFCCITNCCDKPF